LVNGMLRPGTDLADAGALSPSRGSLEELAYRRNCAVADECGEVAHVRLIDLEVRSPEGNGLDGGWAETGIDLAIVLRLSLEKLGIQPITEHELIMGSAFDNVSSRNDVNVIDHLDR